jgi:hypothetical protein
VLELTFVMASEQNLFFVEIVDAIRHELDRMGVRSSVSKNGFPDPREDLVYVLVPPHEFFALHPGLEPPERLLRRSVFICGEQPGTSHFEENVELASMGGALFDFSRWSVKEYARHDIRAEHFQLGYSPLWDHSDPARTRDIDILFMGCITERRSRALARSADSLWRWRSRLVLTDNSAPNWAPSGRFLAGDEKWDALSRSRVLLNIHQGEAPYFEWQRIVQTVANGCVVVSEHSVDYDPLTPGTHFMAGDPDNLIHLAQALLEDEPRRLRMQEDARALLVDQLPLSRSVERLVEVASRIRSGPVPTGAVHIPAVPPRTSNGRCFAPQPIAETRDLSALRAGLKALRLDLLDVRRELATLRREARDGDGRAPLEVDLRSTAYDAASPRLSVLTTVYNYSEHVGRALDSIASSQFRDLEIVVVDDASTDDSLDSVRDWMERNERVATMLVRHATNRGLPSARNTALGFARGELVFILDADNAVYPHGLGRLVTALDSDRGAAFAYGVHQRFTHAGPQDLLNVWPWEPERLRAGNYIDAMAALRTDVLRRSGGYTLDKRLHGWEDYDLWCRLAEQGERGAFVPEVVGRYRSALHSMLSLTDLSSTVAFSVLAERYPRTMGAVIPPA